MKNKILLLIIVIACFIPSVVAFTSYKSMSKAPLNEETAISISIDDINGKNFSYVKEAEGDTADTLIKFFYSARKNAVMIASLPASVEGNKCYKVTISSRLRSESYEYYFSTDPATNYFKTHDGSSYQMNENDAEAFITTEYAEAIYETSTIPTLTLSGEFKVSPDSATWQYKNYTGSFVDSDVSSLVADAAERYELAGGLDLDFDAEPDYCSVTVTDRDGNILYDDMYSNMSEFKFDKLGQVNINVTARWYEDPARAFCGELSYVFLSYVTEPAEFFLGMDAIDAGKFLAVTATNVIKPENIKLTTTLEGLAAPKFYMDGEYAVALIPIDIDTPTGMYSLTFTYGSSIKDLTLAVTNNGSGSSWYSIPDAVTKMAHSDDAVNKFSAASKEIFSKISDTRYFSGSFNDGMTGSYTLMRGFGRYIYVNASENPTYRNNGVDYAASAGLDVTACNAGEVVYAGYLDYSGNIVVIEHGFGLKTWYYNLDSVSVKVGDMVARGDAVGKTGQTGYTGASGAHIAMSVGSTFVSPYDTWEDSPVAGKVIIPKIDE